jgi:glycogen debranching enzyme
MNWDWCRRKHERRRGTELLFRLRKAIASRGAKIIVPMNSFARRCSRCLLILLSVFLTSASTLLAQQQSGNCGADGGPLTLSRTAENWQFLDAVGPHSALLGREDGNFEAWVYPLKLLRDFHLTFHAGDRIVVASSLPRTIIARPESTSIRYAYDSFTVCETWFAPLHDTGAIVTIQLECAEPVSIEAQFEPDVAWMWPAGLGAGYSEWNDALHAFRFGEEQHRFYAIAGSPQALDITQAYSNNYSSAAFNRFQFGPAVKGNATYVFAMAASFEGEKQAQALYQKLLTQSSQLEQEARQYYQHYLDSTVSLALPDRELQTAYDWSRISMVQGLVENPFAGKGLIAGYNISGPTHRPGFSWFFGRDSMWTALALDSIGNFQTTRTALEFLAKYQRDDGKIPHEIPHSVSLVPDWFKSYPYPWASADSSSLYIIAADGYVRASGDVAFVKAKWESLWRAYQFVHSTFGANGLPRNEGVGTGWIEGGPLLPVSTELYQAGVVLASLNALSDLAHLLGDETRATSLAQESTALNSKIESLFWSSDKNFYGYAIDMNGKLLSQPSVLGTVPMWFGLLDPGKSQLYLDVLASPDQQADWGMRIISEKDPAYGPAGYHFGSVWPLFTGWATVAEYRYHRALPAYANLRANAELPLDGSPGRATEVLSGRYYTPLATSSSHQIWSSAMIVSPILRGMMGLSVDAQNSTVRLEPHVPADWTDFSVQNISVRDASLSIAYHRAAGEITLQIQRRGNQHIDLLFSPAFSLRAKIFGVQVNGRRAEFHVAEPENTVDQHVSLTVPIDADSTTVRIRYHNDFGIVYPYVAPSIGAVSANIKFVSQHWNAAHDRLELHAAGVNGVKYEVPLCGDLAGMTANGAEVKPSTTQTILEIDFPPGPAGVYSERTIVLQLPKP